MHRSLFLRLAGVVSTAAIFFAAGHGVSARAAQQADRHALLDVPYMPQTPALCGGAAVAMVLRYWGERGVFPQDFAPLVGNGEGILTTVLASAVRDRGWQAFVVPAADDTQRARIRSEIDRGRPLIALIEVGPRTYHYVVIVGATEREIVVHDPARAPFRVMPWAEFDRAWTAAERWMMLVLPAEGSRPNNAIARTAPPPPDVAVPVNKTPCTALVDRGVDMATSGDRAGAEQALIAATRLCPNDPASWRELGGLRFSQSRWSEAAQLTSSAVRLAPNDTYAWQLLATSRYLSGDMAGALAAWNYAGGPRIEEIVIHGADRTPQPIVARAAGLQPRQTLTPRLFARASRRVDALPVVSSARTKFESADGALAKVDVVIVERDVAPRGWLALSILGARALVQDELRVDVAGSLGAGELASVAWRWPAGRPRVAFDLAVPSPQWLPGIVSFDGSWERQSYGPAIAPGPARHTRRRLGLRIADWSTGWFRWEAGAARDGFREHGDLDAREFLALDGTVDVRLAGDHLALVASGGSWASFSGVTRFTTGGLLAAWRSTTLAARPGWTAMTGIQTASRAAPLALWPGAGTGQGRDMLLRAHPLLDDGVVAGPVFGRRVTHGSLEYARPVANTLGGAVSIAGFVDAARARHRLDGPTNSRLFVDAGVGVRVRAPGSAGVIRLDVAHGLRGGGTTLSAGWGGGWPRRQ